MNILKNFVYNVGYQVLIIIVPLILAPYISRVVGPEGVGTYSYTYSIVSLFGLFANLGISKYGNREISKCGNDREKRSRVFSELISIKISCSIVVLAVYLCYVNVFGGEYSMALLLQVFNLLSFMFDISWFFWGMQEFRVTTTVCAIFNILSVFFVFGFVRTEADTGIYIFIQAFRVFLIQACTWLFLPKYIDVRISWRYITKRHWKSLLLLFFPVFAKYLYSMMDRIMIGNIVGITEVGYYENVQSITLTAVTVLTAIGDVVMPRMTLLYEQNNRKGVDRLFQAVFHLVSFIAVGMTFGFIGVADDFIPLYYGSKFATCVPLLQMIAPVVILSGYSDLIRNVYLLPRYRDREYVVALMSGAAVNFVINFMLIGRLGSAGAIIGTVASECVVMVIQLWFVRSELQVKYFFKHMVIYCLLGSLILVPCSLLDCLKMNPLLNIVVDILAGGGVYAAGAFVYLYFGERKVLDSIKDIRTRKK